MADPEQPTPQNATPPGATPSGATPSGATPASAPPPRGAPNDPTPPPETEAKKPPEASASATILWSVVSVLGLIAVVTWGMYTVLGLSNARELAKENQEVTVRLTNAVSSRICACIDHRPTAAPIGGVQTPPAAPAAPAAPCLLPLEPQQSPGWFSQIWDYVAYLLYGKNPEQTPWQLAQPSLYRTAIPANANFYSAVAALSYAVADERLQSIRSAEESGRRASVFQIMIITIGALTTVVVSLRTMESLLSVSLMRGFSIAAILLSALGTGAASLNSFYAPREAVVRQVRGLVQLKQLHQEIYVYLSAERCDTTPMDRVDAQGAELSDPRARRIRLWHTQLQQIVGGADTSIPDPVDTARPVGPPPPQGGQKAETRQGGQPPPPPAR